MHWYFYQKNEGEKIVIDIKAFIKKKQDWVDAFEEKYVGYL